MEKVIVSLLFFFATAAAYVFISIFFNRGTVSLEDFVIGGIVALAVLITANYSRNKRDRYEEERKSAKK